MAIHLSPEAKSFTVSPKMLALLKQASKGIDYLAEDYTFLALDPGETTGVAVMSSDEVGKVTIYIDQWDTKDLGSSFTHLQQFLRAGFTHVRYEDYRVYADKTQAHTHASLHTAKLIGVIVAACTDAGVDSSEKMASFAKSFWTDDKLRMFDAYLPGMKHGRDALRHLLYYMAFPDL